MRFSIGLEKTGQRALKSFRLAGRVIFSAIARQEVRGGSDSQRQCYFDHEQLPSRFRGKTTRDTGADP
jgi:hypothetical protein